MPVRNATTPLLAAVRKNAVRRMARWLDPAILKDLRYSPNQHPWDAALLAAVSKDHLEALIRLLACHQARPFAPEVLSRVLHKSSHAWPSPCARYLVEWLPSHIDPTLLPDITQAALEEAAERGHDDLVERLLPISEPARNFSRALRLAIEKGHAQCREMLLPHSDLNVLCKWLLSPTVISAPQIRCWWVDNVYNFNQQDIHDSNWDATVSAYKRTVELAEALAHHWDHEGRTRLLACRSDRDAPWKNMADFPHLRQAHEIEELRRTLAATVALGIARAPARRI